MCAGLRLLLFLLDIVLSTGPGQPRKPSSDWSDISCHVMVSTFGTEFASLTAAGNNITGILL